MPKMLADEILATVDREWYELTKGEINPEDWPEAASMILSMAADARGMQDMDYDERPSDDADICRRIALAIYVLHYGETP